MTGQANRIGQDIVAFEIHKQDKCESAALRLRRILLPHTLTQSFRQLKEGILLWYPNISDRDSYPSA